MTSDKLISSDLGGYSAVVLPIALRVVVTLPARRVGFMRVVAT